MSLAATLDALRNLASKIVEPISSKLILKMALAIAVAGAALSILFVLFSDDLSAIWVRFATTIIATAVAVIPVWLFSKISAGQECKIFVAAGLVCSIAGFMHTIIRIWVSPTPSLQIAEGPLSASAIGIVLSLAGCVVESLYNSATRRGDKLFANYHGFICFLFLAFCLYSVVAALDFMDIGIMNVKAIQIIYATGGILIPIGLMLKIINQKGYEFISGIGISLSALFWLLLVIYVLHGAPSSIYLVESEMAFWVANLLTLTGILFLLNILALGAPGIAKIAGRKGYCYVIYALLLASAGIFTYGTVIKLSGGMTQLSSYFSTEITRAMAKSGDYYIYDTLIKPIAIRLFAVAIFLIAFLRLEHYNAKTERVILGTVASVILAIIFSIINDCNGVDYSDFSKYNLNQRFFIVFIILSALGVAASCILSKIAKDKISPKDRGDDYLDLAELDSEPTVNETPDAEQHDQPVYPPEPQESSAPSDSAPSAAALEPGNSPTSSDSEALSATTAPETLPTPADFDQFGHQD